MDYILHIIIFICIYITLSVSLDLVAGHSGLLSLAHAAFYGIGAYSSAILAVRCGAPFGIGILAGMITAALISFMVSLPSLRVRDDYFVVATLAFQMILYSIMNNWMDLTRGPLGIPGIPRPVIFGWGVNTEATYCLLAITMSALSCLCAYMISSSPFGRVLHAIREDELYTSSQGKDTLMFKVIVFAVSAALAAAAGSLYANYITYIDPLSFTLLESIIVLSMVIIGGAGSFWGPVIGAVTLTLLPELLRYVGLPGAVAANIRQMIYGGLLVAFMMWRPQGFLGEYTFRSGGAK